MKNLINRKSQSGSASLFIVAFAITLLAIIVVAFIGLVIRDQAQSSDNELSQSAYDSALSGVEDAKRAIMYCRDNSGDENCTSLYNGDCDTVTTILGGSSSELGSGQSYTCVKLKIESDYVASVNEGETLTVPLRSSDPFNQIKIQWFSMEDTEGASGYSIDTVSKKKDVILKSYGSTARPPILRSQIMYLKPGASLGSLDGVSTDGGAQTYFLYPTTSGSNIIADSGADQDIRNKAIGSANTLNHQSLFLTKCAQGATYACETTINLRGGAEISSGFLSYLNIMPIFNKAHIRISLYYKPPTGSTQMVDFNNIQASVDSNGLAGDLMRRVEARIDLENTLSLNINSAVSVKDGSSTDSNLPGNFCKNFLVASDLAGKVFDPINDDMNFCDGGLAHTVD